MDAAPQPRATVSNLVMSFDEPATYPATPEVPKIVARDLRAERPAPPTYVTDLLALDEATDWAAAPTLGSLDEAAPRAQLPIEDAGVAPERRSAFEIAFLMLAAALAILVATPPLVQLFLAMRGIQA